MDNYNDMRRIYLLLFIFLVLSAHSQVGIGTKSPSKNAALEIYSKTKGLLIPRITKAEKDAMKLTEKDNGLIVFQIDGGSQIGLYFYSSETKKWNFIQGSDGGGIQIDSLTYSRDSLKLYTNDNNIYKVKIVSSNSDSVRFAIFNDKKNNGENGGDFIKLIWNKRKLNNSVENSDPSCFELENVTSNIKIFKKGFYKISVLAPAFSVRGHKVAFASTDITRTVPDTLYGTNEYSFFGGISNQTYSKVDGIIEVTLTPAYFEVIHQCESTRKNIGLGKAIKLPGISEIYTVVKIEKIIPTKPKL